MSGGSTCARAVDPEGGTAVVEFVYLAVLLMVPITYLMIGLFDVQRASFAVTEAARQAGRTYVTSGCDASRAQHAADLALADQGVASVPVQGLACPDPGAAVTVQVRALVRLRGLGALLPADRGGLSVSGRFVAVRDRFAEQATASAERP
ncbi:MAG: hypothetical protein M3P93_02870 [Actinomycetota bacterium]|nr:hypothetical protein [Actinomycetota bacterium]